MVVEPDEILGLDGESSGRLPTDMLWAVPGSERAASPHAVRIYLLPSISEMMMPWPGEFTFMLIAFINRFCEAVSLTESVNKK